MELMLRFIDDASTDSRVSADEEGLASAALASEVECHLNRFAYDPLYAIFLDQMGAQAHPGTRRDPESGLGFEPHGDSEALAKANRKRLSAPFDADGVELWYASASTGQLRHVAPLGRDPDAEEEAESERWTAELLATFRAEDAGQASGAGASSSASDRESDTQNRGSRSGKAGKRQGRRGENVATLVALPCEHALTARLDLVLGLQGWSVQVLAHSRAGETQEMWNPAESPHDVLQRERSRRSEPFFVQLSTGLGVSIVTARSSPLTMRERYLSALFEAARDLGIAERMGEKKPLRLRLDAPVLEQARRELVRRRAITDEDSGSVQ